MVNSSAGPSTIYHFDINHHYSSIETRTKPRITGTTGVETEVGKLGFFQYPFYGTSAAAPHIAAIAAQFRSIFPAKNSTEVQNALTASAVAFPGQTTPWDHLAGY